MTRSGLISALVCCVIGAAMWWGIISLGCQEARGQRSDPVMEWNGADSSIIRSIPGTDCDKLLINTKAVAADNVAQMKRDCSLDDTIDLLCKSGKVCKRVGHNWQSGVYSGYGPGIIIDPAVTGASYRYCVICRKVRNTYPGWRVDGMRRDSR